MKLYILELVNCMISSTYKLRMYEGEFYETEKSFKPEKFDDIDTVNDVMNMLPEACTRTYRKANEYKLYFCSTRLVMFGRDKERLLSEYRSCVMPDKIAVQSDSEDVLETTEGAVPAYTDYSTFIFPYGGLQQVQEPVDGCTDYSQYDRFTEPENSYEQPVQSEDAHVSFPDTGEVIIHTDGACLGNPGPGGWAAVMQCGDMEWVLCDGESDTTNNRMELLGVINALEALTEVRTIQLISDSKYVIDAISKGWVEGWKRNGWIKSDGKPAKNIDLWERLMPLVKKHRIHFSWVKGHSGNPMNERCDSLATHKARLPESERISLIQKRTV